LQAQKKTEKDPQKQQELEKKNTRYKTSVGWSW
jgi:hypothetical protein